MPKSDRGRAAQAVPCHGRVAPHPLLFRRVSMRAHAVCADFERAHGRAPAEADLPALEERAAALAREAGLPAAVVDGALLRGHVAHAGQELPPARSRRRALALH